MTHNEFASALKSRTAAPARPPSSANARTMRKHVGGYFSPAVAKQLRMLASEEETTVQELLTEALSLLFAKRCSSMPSS